MSDDALLRWNRASRGLDSFDAALRWFAGLADPDRQNAIRALAMAVHQSNPTPADIRAAIPLSGLRPTHTPWVMLGANNPNQRIYRLAELPGMQQTQAAAALLSLLSIADARRRAADPGCLAGTCTHWWHGPLPSPDEWDSA